MENADYPISNHANIKEVTNPSNRSLVKIKKSNSRINDTTFDNQSPRSNADNL